MTGWNVRGRIVAGVGVAVALAAPLVGVTAPAGAIAAVPVAQGPSYPPPGNVTFASTGHSVADGGVTYGFTGFDPTAFDELAWGLDPSFLPKIAMDGGAGTMTFSPDLSDLANGVMVWTGTTTMNGINYSGAVDTEFVVKATDVANAAVPLVSTGSLPAGGKFDAVLPDAAAGIGAIAPVPSDGAGNLQLNVNLQFLAKKAADATFAAAGPLYDSWQHADQNSQLTTDVGGAFYALVLPHAALSASNDAPFPSTFIGSTATQPVHVTVTSNGPGDLHLGSTPVALTGANPGDFSIANTTCVASMTLTPTQTCGFDVKFKPTAAGARAATIAVSDDASNSPQQLAFTGTGKPAANLGVALHTAKKTETIGQKFTVSAPVHNGGPSAAKKIRLTELLPANAKYIGSAGSGWTCKRGTSGGHAAVICTRSSLAAGASSTVGLTLKPTKGTSLTVKASVVSSTADLKTGNNSATLKVSLKK